MKKKAKKSRAKYDRLVKEVKRLEELLGYDKDSTGEKSSSSSEEDNDGIEDNKDNDGIEDNDDNNNSFDSA